MTANEIRESGFGKMVRQADPKTAQRYLWHCLKAGAMAGGDEDNLVWQLMEQLGYDKFTDETVARAQQFLFYNTSETNYLRRVK